MILRNHLFLVLGGCNDSPGAKQAEGNSEDTTPLKDAKLIIEHNATDEDAGFQGFVDSEG